MARNAERRMVSSVFPALGVIPYFALHLLLCGTVVAIDFRRSRTKPARTASVLLRALGIIAGGLAISFITAPRLPGGYGFAVMLAWCWTLGIVAPLVLAGAALVLFRAAKPRGATTTLLGAIVIAAVTVRAFVWEPTALEVNHHTVYSARVDRPLTIAVIADLQTDEIGAHEIAALRAVMQAQPDLILFPGDVIQNFDSADHEAQWVALADAAKRIGLAAPLGIVVTPGDVDWTADLDAHARTLGARVLADGVHAQEIRTDVTLTGLSLAESAKPDTLRRPSDAFHIVVGHRPDFAMGNVDADLLIAGHTHGGQVQIPGFGPLLTLSHVPRAWASGRTELAQGRTLVVSRGVGMERGIAPRLRLWCRPEVVFIDVLPAS